MATITAIVNRERFEGNGQWEMDNGQWEMDNGQWRMDNGKCKTNMAQPLERSEALPLTGERGEGLVLEW